MKTKLGPVRFWKLSRKKRHQQCPRQALLKACEPVVNESRGQRQTRTRETPVSSLHEDEVRQTGKGKAERKNQASHNPNIAAQGGGAKNEQEKGYAPINGAYPGVTAPGRAGRYGLFQGFPLRPKVWVVGARFSQR